uniref:Tiorf80 protein n=1 Tax=Agrobacterium tumefaciens TaxID=358 RepID=Q9R6H9_AGRTU|nr:tiorf80 [Agrobacterium tumefaciens]
MWTDVDQKPIRLAALASSGESDFPGIWAHRLTNLRQPQNRWVDWRIIRLTDDQTAPFHRRKDFQRNGSPVDENKIPWAGRRSTHKDWPFYEVPALASFEFCDCVGPFNPNVGPESVKQAIGNKDCPSAFALGETCRQIEPCLTTRCIGHRQSVQFECQKKRRLFEPQAGYHQQVRKQDVAKSVPVACARPLSSVRSETA